MVRMSTEDTATAEDSVVEALHILLEEAEALAGTWEELNLDGIRAELDGQAESIAAEVEARQGARKALAQLAKAAKVEGQSNGSVPAAMSGEVVKSFKAEVDATTKRAKTAEGYFLALYRKLREEALRDPAFVLRRTAELGRASLAILQQRAEATKSMENKAELLIGRLSELGLSNTAQHLGSGGALAALEGLLAEERKSIEVEAERAARQQWEGERVQLLRGCDEAVAAAGSAGDRRVERIKQELAVAVAEAEVGTAAAAAVAELEGKVAKEKAERAAAEEKVAVALRDRDEAARRAEGAESESAATKRDAGTSMAAAAKEVEAARAELAALATSAAALEAQVADLRQRATAEEVDALRQRVALLERIQYEAGDEGGMPAGEGDTGRPTAEEERRACDESGEGGDVVDWVVKHSAKLKARLADEKRRRLDAESRLLEAQEARRALEGELATAHQVVEAGKAMIRSFQASLCTANGAGVAGKGRGASAPKAAAWNPDSSVAEGDVEVGFDVPVTGFGPADRMLAAIQGQRNRFRREANQREGELALSKAITNQLTAEVATLKRDNQKLYKKVRYLSSGGCSGGGKGSVDGMDATEAEYARQYEAEQDPFATWERSEELAAHGRLALPDRCLFTFLDASLPSPPRRHLLLVYLVVLHVTAALCVLARPAGIRWKSAPILPEGLHAEGGMLGATIR